MVVLNNDQHNANSTDQRTLVALSLIVAIIVFFIVLAIALRILSMDVAVMSEMQTAADPVLAAQQALFSTR